MRVGLRQGLAGLASLERDWRDLHAQSYAPRVMSSFEWHDALIRHRLADPESVRFVILHEGSVCQAIVPLVPMAEAPKWLGKLRPWSLPMDTHANLCDIPVARGFTFGRAHAPLWRALQALSPAPFAICLPWNIEGSNADHALRDAGRWLLLRDQGHSCQFDCTAGHPALSGRYAGRLRRSLKRGRSKLSQAGAWQVVRVTEPAGMEAALSTFLELEASGWKGREGAGSAIVLDPRAQAFYRSLFIEHGERLGAEIDLLVLGNRPIAAQLALHGGDTRHTLKIAYDEAYLAQSPGQVLLDNLLIASCDAGQPRTYSLTTCMAWMQDWSPDRIPVWQRWLFRSGTLAACTRLAARFRPVSGLPAAGDRG